MSPRYKHWQLLRKAGQLDEVILQPGRFISDKEIRRSWKYKYYARPEDIKDEITRNTLFWYPPGLHKPQSPLQAEIAGIYLKNVLPVKAQEDALVGLADMDWPLPASRKETATAIARQKGLVAPAPGEILFGFINMGRIERTKALRNQAQQFLKLRYLLEEMDACFARTLPLYHSIHNRPKSPEALQAEQAKEVKEFGGIPEKFRQFLTAFSTITLLRSCPASIHKDAGNARKDQSSFTCLTSIGDKFSGGTFALLEYGYKIPVKPGDIFIAQTTREWHYNTTPVKGTKYSIICYYRRGLANPNLPLSKSTQY